MIKDAEDFAKEDQKVAERAVAKNELEQYVYSLKNQCRRWWWARRFASFTGHCVEYGTHSNRHVFSHAANDGRPSCHEISIKNKRILPKVEKSLLRHVNVLRWYNHACMPRRMPSRSRAR